MAPAAPLEQKHTASRKDFEEFRIDENLQRVNEPAVRCSGGLYTQPGTVLRTVREEVVFAAAGAKIPSATAARPGVIRQAAARAENTRPFESRLVAQHCSHELAAGLSSIE